MRFFGYLFVILILGIFVTSCDSDSCSTDKDCGEGQTCVSGDCKKTEDNGVLSFIGINDGDFIDGYRYDENGTLDGIQMTITAKAENIKEGEEITLMLKGDESSKVTEKLNVLNDGSKIVSFKEFSLKDGDNVLVLKSKDKNGKEVKKEISVKAQSLTLSIVSPVDGKNFTDADDKDPEKYYIQQDVQVEVKGLVAENNIMAKLVISDENGPKYSYLAGPKDGVIIFENVDFRNGSWKLTASIDTRNSITVASNTVNVTAKTETSCNVDIVSPVPENNLINKRFLEDNNIGPDKNIPVKIVSKCPAGFKVKYILNGNEVYNGELQEENGVFFAKSNVVFPENEENNGQDSVLTVKIAKSFDDSGSIGGEITKNYTVDTVAPNFVEVTEPQENEILNTETDLDGDSTNGIQFWVKGKVIGATSTLKIYINSITDSVQEVQVYENAINDEGIFDTSGLPDNQYTTIRMDGNVKIIFLAEDEHKNIATFERNVKVFTSNPNELNLSYNDNNFLNADNNINLNFESVPIKMSKYLEGVLSLVVVRNGEPYAFDDTITVNNPDAPKVKTFRLTGLQDGRYVIYPKFKDTNDFTYRGVDGYLNVKTVKPKLKDLVIVQDVNNDNILNLSEDANATAEGFQTDLTLKAENLYLDNTECENADKQKTVSLKKGSADGVLLAQSEKVGCDGVVRFSNVTLTEGNYKLFFAVNDNFGNSDNLESESLIIDITPPNTDNLFLALSANGVNKILTDNDVLLAEYDENSSEEGLQSAFRIYSDDAQRIKISYDNFEKSENISNGVADMGVLTLKNGKTDIEITATDNNGNKSVKTIRNIEVDTLIPELELSVPNNNVDDTLDEDSNRPGIQMTIQVKNMTNIEEGQIVYIQKSSNDGGNISWVNIAQFVKDSNSDKDISITLPLGDYSLRAKAADINNQEGYSNEVTMSVTSSLCTIVSVKKGNIELVSGNNFINASDLNNGKVTLTVKYTASCSARGATELKVKKNNLEILTEAINSNLSNDIEIPFSDGEIVSLTFEMDSNPLTTASYMITADTTYPSAQRLTPTSQNIVYVNTNNPFIGTSGNENKIGDLNEGMPGAQFSIRVKVTGAQNGSVELIDNDGTSQQVLQTINNIASNDENLTFNGTLTDNKTHTIKLKVTDEAGNISLIDLYTAVVDVTNPGTLSNLDYEALSDTERRKAELNLTWNQSGAEDVNKYVIRYSNISFNEGDFENLPAGTYKEVVINNPDLTEADYTQKITSLIFHKNYTIAVRAYDEVGNAGNIIIKSTQTDLDLVSGANAIVTDTGDYKSNITDLRNVGDINDDGYDDFVVAQELLNDFKGEITIYYGSADPMNIGNNKQVIDGVEDYEQFGTSIAGGDFNCDGKADLVVGRLYSSWYNCSEPWGCYMGGVRIYFNQGGGSSLDTSSSNYIDITDSYLSTESNLYDEGSWKAGRLGDFVTFIGDVDGDGCDDLAVSETGAIYNGNKGRVYIVKGRSENLDIDLDNDSGTILLQHNSGSNSAFGISVTAGDFDNQGSVDVAVGDKNGKSVYVYYLDDNSSGIINEGSSNVVKLIQTNNNFGTSLLTADLNGDGNDDLIVGSGGAQNVKAFFGGNKFNGGAAPNITYSFNGNTSPNFGYYIDAGDLNGDGKDDVLISGTDYVKVFLSKDNYSGRISSADVELNIYDDSLGVQTSILRPLAVSVNDDNNDGKFDENDIEDFVIMNNKDREFFVRY